MDSFLKSCHICTTPTFIIETTFHLVSYVQPPKLKCLCSEISNLYTYTYSLLKQVITYQQHTSLLRPHSLLWWLHNVLKTFKNLFNLSQNSNIISTYKPYLCKRAGDGNTHTCMHACTHTCTYVHTHTRTHTHTHIHARTHIF